MRTILKGGGVHCGVIFTFVLEEVQKSLFWWPGAILSVGYRNRVENIGGSRRNLKEGESSAK